MRKFGCYVLEVGHKEMTMHEIKMLGLSIEEAVNEAAKSHGGDTNHKAQYQRYVFDFFKDVNEDLETDTEYGGYTEKILLPYIGKSYNSSKKRLQLNYYAIAFGASIDIEYEVEEENQGRSVLNVTLNSGDAFVTNSKVKSISYRVKKVSEKYS